VVQSCSTSILYARQSLTVDGCNPAPKTVEGRARIAEAQRQRWRVVDRVGQLVAADHHLAVEDQDHGEDEQPATADVEGLRRFLEGEVLPWFDNRRKELANRPLIREQAFGEALDPDKLERLGRYEIHLDRKLERMLAMLLRLKDLRREPVES